MSIQPDELYDLLLGQVAETGDLFVAASEWKDDHPGDEGAAAAFDLMALDHEIAINAVEAFIADNPDFSTDMGPA